MPMFNGLTGKRQNDMVGLLQEWRSVQEISEWLDVNPEYIISEAKRLGIKPGKKGKGKDSDAPPEGSPEGPGVDEGTASQDPAAPEA